MNKPVTITFLANAGLLLQYDGHALLLDALQKSEATPFSPLPAALEGELFRGGTPLSDADALLFTHLHPDHFSAGLTLQYMERWPRSMLLLPNACGDPCFDAAAAQAGTRLISFPPSAECARFNLTPNISVFAFATRHLGKQYHRVPHICYLLCVGEKNILITGDIDYTFESLHQLDGVPLHAAFVTPLFFSALRRGRFFKGTLEATHICVYHIPFEADDQFQVRRSLHRDLSLWQGQSQVIALKQPCQALTL